MQKIMFNDKYGLAEAVLQGRKTMTRRMIKPQYETIKEYNANFETYLLGELDGETFEVKPCYYIGEVLAIAQSYKDAGYTKEWAVRNIIPNPNAKPTDPFEKKYPGWNNKMFVKADLMPHRIRITDIKVERLQDISAEDCIKEGFKCISVNNGWGNYANHWEAMLVYYDKLGRTKTIQSRDPREAFSYLIDKVSGRETWDRNPWVFAYSFEVVKK